MNVKHSIALLAFVIPGIAIAQDAGTYQCTHGDLVRRVEILTEPGLTVPCEVHYYKDTEAPGESQVLWSAQTEKGYCEAKAEEFVARLKLIGACIFKKGVYKRGFSVINVRDDREISNVFSSFLIRHEC